MATAPSPRVPAWFWAAAGLGLVWNLIGAATYLGHVGALGGPFAPPPAPTAMPGWATAAFAIGVWGGVLGTVLLLLRSGSARIALWVSLAATAVDWFWVFFMSGQGVTPLGVTVMVGAVLLALLGEAASKRGWLR